LAAPGNMTVVPANMGYVIVNISTPAPAVIFVVLLYILSFPLNKLSLKKFELTAVAFPFSSYLNIRKIVG